jgi:hypothetical protein
LVADESPFSNVALLPVYEPSPFLVSSAFPAAASRRFTSITNSQQKHKAPGTMIKAPTSLLLLEYLDPAEAIPPSPNAIAPASVNTATGINRSWVGIFIGHEIEPLRPRLTKPKIQNQGPVRRCLGEVGSSIVNPSTEAPGMD